MNVHEFSEWIEKKRQEALAENTGAKTFQVNVIQASVELKISISDAANLMIQYVELMSAKKVNMA